MFKQWLSESITVPPHMSERFLREANQLFQNIESLVLSVDTDKIYKITKGWSNSSSEQRAIVDISDDYYHIQRLIRKLDAVSFYGELMSHLDSDKDPINNNYLDNRFKNTSNAELLQLLDKFHNHKDQFHYIEELISSLKENEDYIKQEGEEYDIMLKDTQSFKEATQKLFAMNKWYKVYCEKVDAIFDLKDRKISHYYLNQSIHPKTGHTETLYHATVAVSQILKEGFKTRNELGNVGALGGGPGHVISFTSDIKIAESIVWALRRAVQIAQGQFSSREIMKMMQDYGVKEQDKEKMLKHHSGSWGTEQNSKNIKQWNFELFRHWLMVQKRIYNPVFSYVSVEDFVHVNIRDIGIIGAEVKMNKENEYLWAMEEYRVPKSAILSIWRVPYKGKESSYWN